MSFVNCKVCGQPAVMRIIEKDDKRALCKEHGLQYLTQFLTNVKQPTAAERVHEISELEAIPTELQNLRS